MTTCPSGVNYMHLVDQARAKIEKDYTRPVIERLLRAMLAWIFPWPELFGAVMTLAQFGRPLAALLPTPRAASVMPTLLTGNKVMLALAPASLPPPGPIAGSVLAAQGKRRGRVALLQVAFSRCWCRESIRPLSTCSRVTASKSYWSRANNVAAR